ncbi:MAG TPA: beta-ketoacyl-[acyl-carrier-protein] synthase II, partial [Planctomycetaceae bacterium]|nr:beta-ketoacyl-[acyl-carrier-protein] synthase II [Planctomycetaceae bacterium]
MKRRVVVTGLGVVTALGCRVDELWTRVCNGESGIRPFVGFDCSKFQVRFGGQVTDNWSLDGYVGPKDAKRLDRFCQFALTAAVDAMKQSGIDFAEEDPFRCGVIIGSGIGGLSEIEVQHTKLIERGPDKVSPFTIPKLMVNAASGQVSIQFGLQGPNTAVSTACASASNAIADAVKTIERGAADVMITGGSEAALTPMAIAGFTRMKALSERNDDPARASRPFDRDRDGFVMAEGAGVLVLESLEHAQARGAEILAEMLGCGATADGSHITQPNENGTGAARAMSVALADAQMDVTEIDYINTHGTSTPLGDQAETKAIKSVFGEHARRVAISSTKSQLGHLLGASGGVELVLSILAIKHNLVPPTINYETPDPVCDLDYTPNQARERAIRTVMSNSFGFGGTNAT